MKVMISEASKGIGLGTLVTMALTRPPPSRPAFVFEGSQWSYKHTADLVFSVARALKTAGLRHGDGIALLTGNRPEAFVVRVAAQLIGCRFTALNALASVTDQTFIVADAEIRLLVADPAFAEQALEVAKCAGCPKVMSIGPGGAPDLLKAATSESSAPLASVGTDRDIATISYTGGTTGKPKGVVLPHRTAVQNIMMVLAEYELPRDTRLLLSTPLSHAAGSLVLPTFLRGGTVYVLPKFDVDRILAAVERENINALMAVPTMIYDLLQDPGLDQRNLSSLETIIYGAAPINPTRLEEAVRRIGPVFMQHYGQTEAPNTICLLRKPDHDHNRPHLFASCGRPMMGLEVAILDNQGREVAVGVDGEVCVRGALVMDEYCKRPEETKEVLRDGWLHTGDIARRDGEGYFYIVGRTKDMIISGGYNIYPREIEDLLASCAGVAKAAVIGIPDERWGEAVTAIIVPCPGVTLRASELIEHVKKNKGSLHAPKSVKFVDQLPLTPVGKIDKQALRRLFIWN